ncbi:MAG TPA: ATP-dependent DNA ligase, partial [Candidatus Nanoarchaeia archaeon]|nr:ATP-dependent DNA ligase [Candidatus Nanoarchaeia archaeon]
MIYLQLCEVYEDLKKNPSRLKKTEILSKFLRKLIQDKDKQIIYLLQGKVFPDYDEREFGISEQLCIKVLEKSSGISKKEIISKWRKTGDLGLVSEEIMLKKKQNTLFSHKLTTEKVLDNLKKLPELVGKGTVDKKMALISELLTSASGIEAKYIVRTLLGDLRIGVASGTIRDSITNACFDNKDKRENIDLVQGAYDKSTDFALVFEKACRGIKELKKIELSPGHPLKVMLALKAESIKDGFERVGSPAVFEYKYDGFRMLINKDESENIKIFTRRLDNVTKQFPDVVKYVKENINAKSFIIDCEAVGYNKKTKEYTPFQDISQRIKRKHHIEKLIQELPIELNVFDILYYNGTSLIEEPFEKRTKIIRKLIKNHKYKIRTAEQLITSDEKKAEKFYKEALENNQEGVMIKNMKSPYKPGARVGHMLKLKPAENELDLVITGAEYGKGKRAGAYATFTISCFDKKANKFLEIGKASGLKEKEELGLSFIELTNKLKHLIVKEKGREVIIKPEIVVTVLYQNIQRSPTYESGFALRFPRITSLRPDRRKEDIATIKE